ncbi:MAG: hypothetical protein Q7S08_00510 [bacterium]|nr:hypothetical protein [bacterium]
MADDAQSVPAPDEPTLPTTEGVGTPTASVGAESEPAPTSEPTPTESVTPAEPTPEVIPEVSQSPSEPTASPVSDRLQAIEYNRMPDPSAPASPEPQPIPSASVPPPPQQPSAEQTVQATQSKRWSDADRARANATRARKYEARLAKIVLYARTHGRVANDSIVKLLRVSDATASRYAKMLVARGALAQEGKGRGAHYNFKP